MASAQKRISRVCMHARLLESMLTNEKEYAELQANPLEGVAIQPIDANLFKWIIELTGPKDTPYAGGNFKLLLTLPDNYPFKPPVLQFQTKIYHPNVSNDDKGSMCLGILRSDTWKPSCKISAVLEMARGLLMEPNPEDAVENSIAEEYKNKRASFDKTAKDWTKQYANGK